MKNSQAAINLRQEKLLSYLLEHHSADNDHLAQLLGVTTITIRRDLKCLEDRGLVKRYFGGAECIMPMEEGKPLLVGADTYIPKSRISIARYAAQMIQNKDTVFMNSSSTALLMLEYLNDKSILVVTNNGRSLYTKRQPGTELILTGGEVYGQKQSLIGEFSLNALSKITATKCILGVSGISVSGGITSRVLQETAINQMMLNRCSGDKIIVADGSKIGVEHNFFSGNISDITHLITDETAPAEHLQKLESRGVKIIIARG